MAFIKSNQALRDYTVIDFETTGLSPRTCEIIELAALRVRDDQVAEQLQMLVKPSVPISPFITELTGITEKMLDNAPAIQDVLNHYLSFLGQDTLMGHNIQFDLGFLKAVAPTYSAHYLDTMHLSREFMRGERRHRLQDLCRRYQVNNISAHRAMGDCLATWQCYVKLKEQFN